MNLRLFKKFDSNAKPIKERQRSLNQLLVSDIQSDDFDKRITNLHQNTLRECVFKILPITDDNKYLKVKRYTSTMYSLRS